MAISFVGSKAGSHAVASAQSVSLTDLLDGTGSVATLALNDLVIVTVAHSEATTPTRTLAQLTPTGYGHPPGHSASVQGTDTNAVSLVVSHKFMGSTPDTTISIPAAASTSCSISYTIEVFRGCDPNSPFSGNASSASGANTGAADVPNVTMPATSGAVVVGCLAAAVTTTVTTAFTNPGTGPFNTGTNNFQSAIYTGSAIPRAVSGMGFKTGVSPFAAYSPGAAGGSSTANTASWAAMALILLPWNLKTLTWQRGGFDNINFGYVSEKAAAGASVGFVGSTSTVNSGRTTGSTLSISGTGNTGSGRFAIDATTGEITVVSGATFNFSTEATISLDIVETLSGTNNNNNVTTVTIRVLPIMGGSSATVSWDTNDRMATNLPATVTATSVTGTNGVGSPQPIRSSHGYNYGDTAKVYVEFTIGTIVGGFNVGVAEASFPIKLGGRPGQTTNSGLTWNQSGTVYANSGIVGAPVSGASYTTSDVLMLAFDVSNGKMWIGLNGTWLASGNPATGSTPLVTLTSQEDWFLSIAPETSGQGTVNWGDSAFTYTAPTGFTSYKTGTGGGGTPGSASGALSTVTLTPMDAGAVGVAAAGGALSAVTVSALTSTVSGQALATGILSSAITVSALGAGAVGQAAASGALSPVTVTSLAGAATGVAAAGGAFGGTVTVSALGGTAGVSVFATGVLSGVTVTSMTGGAVGQGAAAGALGTVTATPMTGGAIGVAQTNGSLTQITITSLSGFANGGDGTIPGFATGSLSTITLGALGATATAAANISSALAAINVTPLTATAAGAAAVSGSITTVVTATPLTGGAKGQGSVTPALPTVTISSLGATATAAVSITGALTAVTLSPLGATVAAAVAIGGALPITSITPLTGGAKGNAAAAGLLMPVSALAMGGGAIGRASASGAFGAVIVTTALTGVAASFSFTPYTITVRDRRGVVVSVGPVQITG